jgi:hypothetical protein
VNRATTPICGAHLCPLPHHSIFPSLFPLLLPRSIRGSVLKSRPSHTQRPNLLPSPSLSYHKLDKKFDPVIRKLRDSSRITRISPNPFFYYSLHEKSLLPCARLRRKHWPHAPPFAFGPVHLQALALKVRLRNLFRGTRRNKKKKKRRPTKERTILVLIPKSVPRTFSRPPPRPH